MATMRYTDQGKISLTDKAINDGVGRTAALRQPFCALEPILISRRVDIIA